jgi:hypothetical protein
VLIPWGPLSQPELDRHFDQHVYRRAEPPRGSESPLPDRIDCPLIQSSAETLQHAHGSNAAIAAHHDLEDDVA